MTTSIKEYETEMKKLCELFYEVDDIEGTKERFEALAKQAFKLSKMVDGFE